MLTIAEGQVINGEVIKEILSKYIKDYKGKRQEDSDYYDGLHAILKEEKAKVLSDVKVIINHSKYITDIATGYLLGNPVDYQAAKQETEKELEVLRQSIKTVVNEFKEQDFDSIAWELAQDCSIYGVAYGLNYADGNNPRTVRLNPIYTFCVYDDTVKHSKVAGVTFRPPVTSSNAIADEVQVYTENGVTKYLPNKDGDFIAQPQTKADRYYFGDIPIVEFVNNAKRVGDARPVKALIDAYNRLQSDRVNDKVQLVEALLLGFGFTLEDADMDILKAYRTLTGLDKDARAEYLVKQLNETDVDTLRQVLEQDIHKISGVPNLSDKEFSGNSSGVAIKFKLLGFEQLTLNKERYFSKGLREVFRQYNAYLVNSKQMQKTEVIPLHQLRLVFKRNLPQNDYEISQTIVNLSGKVSDETLVGQVSFVEDASEEVAKAREEAVNNMVPMQYGSLPLEYNDKENQKDTGETTN